METALINSAVGIVLRKLNTMIQENKKLRDGLKKDLLDIKHEMGVINGAVVKFGESKDHREWIREIQELAYDIEDKIDEFIDRVTCPPEAGWFNRKLVHPVKTMDSSTQFGKDIRDLKQRALQAAERKRRYEQTAAESTKNKEQEPQPGPSLSNPYIPEKELVGIDGSKQELLGLLEAEVGFRVISIVGRRGIGKTTLANVVFKSPDYGKKFPSGARAWVVASECNNARDLVADILSKLTDGATNDTTSSLADLGEKLLNYLQKFDRYLIVIDDIQTHVWQSIKSSFPTNTNGRIIVTTSTQSIGKTCSSSGGCVYRMQPLDDDDSRSLLVKEVFGSHARCPTDFEGSTNIIEKCNGLPLALVNIAQYLKPNSDQLTRNKCSKVCRDLGYLLDKEQALSRMKQALIHTYSNLPDPGMKTCFLSVSIFPHDHHIKRKSLVRRWLAEGLVVKKDSTDKWEDVANGYFEELVDRSLIQPIHSASKATVKECQVHGIVLDFIVQKSVSDNFINFIRDNEPIVNTEVPCAVRRVSLHNTGIKEGGATVNIDLSRIRSLTMFGHVGQYVNFQKCKLLRILDLEDCTGLEGNDFKNICRLLQLRYLSLRGTNANKIPKEISNLHYLETLDMRKTNVSILRIEVLMLPQITHLFGKFKLPCELNKVREGHRLLSFFSHKSKLQTLAGFVMDENNGFQHIMSHTKKLRKVKIWSESNPSSDSISALRTSLQSRFCDNDSLQSLSIHFGNHSINFLGDLKHPCVLTSIKLHGNLTKLPHFIKSLQDLELNLSSNALSTETFLVLQSIKCLLYLKLVENCSGFADVNLSVQSHGFQKLQRLCIQAQKFPKLSIAKGAMPHLTSFYLICVEISNFSFDDIKHLEDLQEIGLATSVSTNTREAWEAATKKHKNRPVVSILKCSA